MRPIVGMEEYRERIRGSLEFIERDLARPFDLDVLARRTCMAPFHFHSVFRKTVGCAPKEYLRSRRLSMAAQELVSTSFAIDRVGPGWGYASPEAFSRAFRKQFHVWPGEYRRLGRALFLQDSELTIPVELAAMPGLVKVERRFASRRVYAGLFLRGENRHAENMRLLYRFLQRMPESGGDGWINADRYVPVPGGTFYEFFVGREVEGEWAVEEGLEPLVVEPRQEMSFHLRASIDDLHGADFQGEMDREIAGQELARLPEAWKVERRWGPERWTRRVYRVDIGVEPLED